MLQSDLDAKELRAILTAQYERNWRISIRPMLKRHFLGYAARYVRRPPIAQRRFVRVTEQQIEFLTKDKKLKQVVTTQYSLERFISLLAEHVPDRYFHSIRYFGLLAPRTRARTWATLFLLLGQERRSRPRRLSWQSSLRKHFGVDPLIDHHGQAMKWTRRERPLKVQVA
jgi:hypothetical protein